MYHVFHVTSKGTYLMQKRRKVFSFNSHLKSKINTSIINIFTLESVSSFANFNESTSQEIFLLTCVCKTCCLIVFMSF